MAEISGVQNFKNVITGKGKVEHIPHFGNYWSWKYYDAGYKLSEALYDYSKMKAAIETFVKRYPMDIYYETGWRNPVQLTGVLGNTNGYIIDDETYALSIKDQDYMADEDYDKLIENPEKYLWEVFIPSKLPALKEEGNNEALMAVVGKYAEFGGAMGEIGQMVASHGGLNFFDPDGPAVNFMCGYELLFNNLRGMKKLSMDMRRRPEQVADAIQALDEFWALPRLERTYKEQPMGSNPDYCVDTNPVLLGHIIMSPKQFEKFYWPHLKRVADCAEARDKLVYLFVEGSSKRFWDFFREFPENRYVFHGELDDVFEAKEAMPNLVVAGGMGTMLGDGTPEQCVERTKELIEKLGGEEHRYIFTADKMISFPQDCKRENLKAICDYLNSIHY